MQALHGRDTERYSFILATIIPFSPSAVGLHRKPIFSFPTASFQMKMQGSKELISTNTRNPNQKNCHRNISLLEGEEIFFNKLLSRESSKGFSSRIYYRAAVGSIPFKWEAQPGKPKVELESQLVTPLRPSPAMMALTLPHPQCNRTTDKGSTMSKLFFWMKKAARKTRQSHSRSQKQSQVGSEDGGLSRADSFGFWINEGDSASSPCDTSSSSLSSSRSSFSGFSTFPKLPALDSRMMEKASSKRRGMEGLDEAWRRSPWRFAGVMVCMAMGD